jgi:hypothetical protein
MVQSELSATSNILHMDEKVSFVREQSTKRQQKEEYFELRNKQLICVLKIV